MLRPNRILTPLKLPIVRSHSIFFAADYYKNNNDFLIYFYNITEEFKKLTKMPENLRLNRLLSQYASCKLTKEELRKDIESGAVGFVSGIVGPFVCRYWNGRQLITDRALFYRKSLSPASVEGRRNFAAKVRFAKFLMDNKDIKEIWTKADIAGTRTWNRIIKHNDVKGDYPTAKNMITPDNGDFRIDNICTMNKDLSIKINYVPEAGDNLLIVVVPFDPLNNADPAFEMLRIDGYFLSDSHSAVIRKYRKYIIYSAVVRPNGECSATAAAEGSIEEEYCEEYILLFPVVCCSEAVQKAHRKTFYVLRL